MLIRFVVNNIFSFGDESVFHMLPMSATDRLREHKYIINDFEILKMSSIYGANGAGKSNLVNALSMLKMIVKYEEIPSEFANTQFKFKQNDQSKPQTFVVEYFQDNNAYLYGIEILDGVIISEELYLSGLGKNKDKLLYERKTDIGNNKTEIITALLENDTESQTLRRVIEKNLCKPEKIVLRLLTTLDNENLKVIEAALKWFDSTLHIVTPNSRPGALVQMIETDDSLKRFAEDIMRSFYMGIEGIECQRKTLTEFFGEDNLKEINNIKEKLNKKSTTMLGIINEYGEELIFIKEKNDIYVKKLQFEHKARSDVKAVFNLYEESDGTIRLLDFIPAFHGIVNKSKVFVIDEIERSIHPLLIKELIDKFSQDRNTKGQLIFTTHESNLLDQSLFRQDEIWFAEKNHDACTDLYSLSDFHDQQGVNIRKGYLTGRYGSIPFIANLKDLNWQNYDIKE